MTHLKTLALLAVLCPATWLDSSRPQMDPGTMRFVFPFSFLALCYYYCVAIGYKVLKNLNAMSAFQGCHICNTAEGPKLDSPGNARADYRLSHLS